MSSPLYIGLLSGTSMDAVDCALVDFSSGTPQLLDFICREIDQDLKLKLLSLTGNNPIDIRNLGSIDIDVAILFASTADELLKKTNSILMTSPLSEVTVKPSGMNLRNLHPSTPSLCKLVIRIPWQN